MKFLLGISLLLLSFDSLSQHKKIMTEISADNIFELSIIKVYPDSFPNVSVVFQAKNEFGKPLWLLEKTELEIKENEIPCEIIRLINITENKPLNIGLVFDHSGSMFDNSAIGQDTVEVFSSLYFAGLPYPSEYVTSLDLAKEGVLEFIDNIESTSDSIVFVGFSEIVDKVLPLSNDPSKIKTFMKEVEPEGSTAFYDAIYLAIDSLVVHSSSPVIVAITDGQDNSSDHTYLDVIKKAKKHNVPIYIIGLGNVDEDRLKHMCEQTDGFFYQTNDPNKLKEIYANIKEQLKSIYQVDYTSSCTSFDTDERTITFSFLNDTLSFSKNSELYKLPKEAIEYLEEQETIRLAKIREAEESVKNKWLLAGGVGGSILLLGIATFIIVRKRKKQSVKLETLYPNPFENEITINYLIPDSNNISELRIYDMSGKVLEAYPLDANATEITVQLPTLNRGIYLFNITSGTEYSKTYKAVKR